MRKWLDALRTKSYAEWSKAIVALRDGLDGGSTCEIDEMDLLMILRPYMWWRHNPGFEDVMATCERAMAVIVAKAETLGDVRSVGDFLATYLDDGKHDKKGSEITTKIAAERWAKRLKGKDAKALRELAALMTDLYQKKHTSYWVLRHVGKQRTDTLAKLIHGLVPADQAFILHALDGNIADEKVLNWYRAFIKKTPYPELKKAAREYALLS
jgi:hypothetical protein